MKPELSVQVDQVNEYPRKTNIVMDPQQLPVSIQETHYEQEISKQSKCLDRLKIRKENILSVKIRANDFDFRDAKRFDSFFSLIFNCKMKHCCFNKKLNNTQLSSASLRSISLAPVFMLKK